MSKLTDQVRPVILLQSVSALTGGGAGKLDGIATVSLSVPLIGYFSVSGTVYFYKLEAGTDAESSPNVIRPDDYATTTNEKVWKLQGLFSGSLSGALLIANNLSDLASASTARTNLGLGTAAVLDAGTASGVATLTGSAKHTPAEIPFGSSSNTVCEGNDSRLSDSRTPNGSAGGDLGGSYPNPTVAKSSTAFAFTGIISDTFTTQRDDYNPTGLSSASVIRATNDGGGPSGTNLNITSLAGGSDGRIIILQNVSTKSNATITLTHDDGSTGTAANRFHLLGSASLILRQRNSAILVYDATESRWKVQGCVHEASSTVSGLLRLTGGLGGTATSPTCVAAGGAWQFSGLLSPSQITSDQNDYSPTNESTSNYFRINSDAARSITGWAGSTPASGLWKMITNVGSFPITFKHQDSGSTAARRYIISTGADLVLQAGDSMIQCYDSTTSRWRIFGTPANDSRLSDKRIPTDAYALPYRNLWIGAEAMVARTTNGAAGGSTESTTNKIMVESFDFDDTTQEYVQFKVAMPDRWDRSTIKVKAYWVPSAGSGGVVWSFKGGAFSDQDTVDTALGTAQTIADTATASTKVHVSAATPALTVGGTPALGDLCWFEVSRVVGDGSDDMVGDAKLLGIMIQFKETTPESAW